MTPSDLSEPAATRNLTKQQKIEGHYFELFQNAYPLPKGLIVPGDAPDFILHGRQKIGIEITNFYVADGACEASEQVQRKRREEAVRRAQQFYQQAGGQNIQLSFSFDRTHPIKNVKSVAQSLANFARRVEGDPNGRIRRRIFEDIPELDFAYLYARQLQYSSDPDPKFPDGCPDPNVDFPGFREYQNRRQERALREGIYKPLPFTAKWQLIQLHDFGVMNTERLTNIIKSKAAKVRQYTSCDAYWLIVIVEFIDAAQEQEIRIDGFTVESGVFQKIIVYKPHFEHIVEIKS